MRLCCLIVLLAIASLSSWALPVEDDHKKEDQHNLLVVDDGHQTDLDQDVAVESRILDEDDEDDDKKKIKKNKCGCRKRKHHRHHSHRYHHRRPGFIIHR